MSKPLCTNWFEYGTSCEQPCAECKFPLPQTRVAQSIIVWHFNALIDLIMALEGMMLRIIAAGGITLLATLSANAFDPANFQGFGTLATTSTSWQNQSGSTMTINIDTSGNVTGHYINRASGTGCQGTPYVLNGRVNGNFIAFSVAWSNATANCNSVTGWAGYAQAVGSNVEIVTNWNLAYQGGSGSQIGQGSDTFTYVPQSSTESFLSD